MSLQTLILCAFLSLLCFLNYNKGKNNNTYTVSSSSEVVAVVVFSDGLNFCFIRILIRNDMGVEKKKNYKLSYKYYLIEMFFFYYYYSSFSLFGFYCFIVYEHVVRCDLHFALYVLNVKLFFVNMCF